MGRTAVASRQTTATVQDLVPHPKNYRTHTDLQLDHICASITEHGIYRNIVVANDGQTILAGHGVVLAAARLQLEVVPVIVVDLEPYDPRALKLLIGDNEIARRAEVDDRALSDMLREINDDELTDLLGTGFDAQMLSALVMVTRPASEIQDHQQALEWVGMPDLGDPGEKPIEVIMRFARAEDRDSFYAVIGCQPFHLTGTHKARAIWWPLRRNRSRAPEVREEADVVIDAAAEDAALSDLRALEGQAEELDRALSAEGGDGLPHRDRTAGA